MAKAESLLAHRLNTRRSLRPVEHAAAPPHPGAASHALFKRDVDYVVKDGQVVIVDESRDG